MSPEVIKKDPDFGEIRGYLAKGISEWMVADPVRLPFLQMDCTLSFFVEGDYPTQHQKEQIQGVLDSSPAELRAAFAEKMFEAYSSHIRPEYLPLIGQDRCSPGPEHLPDLSRPEDIWSLVRGMNYLHVEPEGDLVFQFRTVYDDEHCTNVRFCNKLVTEVWVE